MDFLRQPQNNSISTTMPSLPCQCSGCSLCSAGEAWRKSYEEGPCVQNQARDAKGWARDMNHRLLCSACRDHWKEYLKIGTVPPQVLLAERNDFDARDMFRQQRDYEYFNDYTTTTPPMAITDQSSWPAPPPPALHTASSSSQQPDINVMHMIQELSDRVQQLEAMMSNMERSIATLMTALPSYQ